MIYGQTQAELRKIIKELKQENAMLRLERRMALTPRKEWLSMVVLPPVITRHNREQIAA
jgi:hypothetical protein